MKNNKKIKASNIQTSISSVIGSATSFYISWIKSRFPNNFFKDMYVSGMLTSIETERRDIVKKNKPLLIVRPEYAGENGFIETLPYWHSTLQYVFNDTSKYYTEVFKDPEKNIAIYAIPDRIKIDFPTRMIIPTKVYGINLLHYMKNIIEPGGHGFINNVYFENELPSSFVNMIFDAIFNTENKNFNKTVESKIKVLEKKLCVKEVKVIECLKEITKLNNIHDEEGIVTKEESEKSLELNILVSQLNREIKLIKKEIDEIKKEYKEIKYLNDPDPEKRKINRELLENYFNKFSNCNIVNRKNTSTGNFEFAFKNRSNILVHMDSLPTLDSTRKGRTEDYAVVSFEVSLDFNTNSNFILEVGPDYIPTIDNSVIENNPSKYQFNTYFEENIPRYFIDDDRYYLLRKKQKFSCDFNVDVDKLDFSDILDEDCKEIYNNVTDNDYMDVFRIKLFLADSVLDYVDEKNNNQLATYWRQKELVENVDYTVNWNNKTINIIKPLSNVNYLFTFYINQYRVNMINMEKEKYKKTLLIEKTKDNYIFEAVNGQRYILSVEDNGIIRTDKFTLNSRIQGIKKCQLKSINNKIFDLYLDEEGMVVTSETTNSENLMELETSKYKITIDDEGCLITEMK